MSSPHQNEEPIERHNPTIASTRVHILDLYPRKASCFRSMFPSCTSTPFMQLGYFTKLLHLSIYIKLMVDLMPTIPWVSPPLSLISISTLSVSSYDVAMVAPLLDLAMHPPMHYFIRDPDSSLLARFIELCEDTVLRYSSSTCAIRCT
ncbi:hypothetical protein BHM03_00028338 [Ensete ventricosum]|nr:hypothetical protein BHM03_00028338 [Ensete ventricosum]